MNTPVRRRSVAVLAALGLSLSIGMTAQAATRPGTPVASLRSDVTSRVEARRVDRVPIPDLGWFDCSAAFGPSTECGTAQLPLDYDAPRGATTDVAVLRLPAPDQRHKIGTLFVNPGGPGGSSVSMAAQASTFLSSEVLARFDIVGMDPRGTNFSADVRCFADLGAQSAALAGMSVAFPWGSAQERAFVTSARGFGEACSTTGRPLTAHMSTADVARDMDVLRRTVGDSRLTYLGFSYGSYLGNVYANLFPDRVRAVAIDGVLDPVAWAGTPATADVPQTARLRSADGSAKALDEILTRCTEAGADYCPLAVAGDPAASYDRLISALRRAPIELLDPDTGEVYLTLGYATVMSILLSDLYYPEAGDVVASDVAFLLELLDAPAPVGSAEAARQRRAEQALTAKFEAARAASEAAIASTTQQRQALGLGFPYDNSPDAFQTVLCTDGLNPPEAARWRSYAAIADETAPGFGRLWTWVSAPCASRTWTVRDEDAYLGPFTARTANPVLVVGNYWDPATNYDGAVAAAALLPTSRLLSSDSWGHTAYGTSACVTGAVDTYLLTREVPAVGTTCTGDVQPFTVLLDVPGEPESRSAVPPSRRSLPPVVPPLPGAVPRT